MVRRSKAPLVMVFPLLLVLALVAFFLFRDSAPPVVALTPEAEHVSPNLEMTVTVIDADSPIKSLSITAKRGDRIIPVADEIFTGSEKEVRHSFSLGPTGLKDGEIELTVTAMDHSFGGFGRGNKAVITRVMRVDSVPPRVQVKTGTPYVRKGGTGCVLYSINKEVTQTGVKVGDLFFPGYKQPNGDFLCFFAFPYNLTPRDYKPVLFAVDAAGNTYNTGLDVNRLDQQFKSDTINITQSFLDAKAAEFEAIVPGSMGDVERFRMVNGPVRAACAEELLRIGKDTGPEMQWSGAFLRLPKSASRAGFADHRTYLWNGEKIDEQTHLGYDFASTARAPVPAANSGRVIYSAYLGIYGNLVVIDHGAGLQSLYSHLSESDVDVGQIVKKGDIIGKTGKSGMAGGDHLHFGMLVSGFEVTPLEWLDPKWIRDNITSRLKAAGLN